MTTRAAVCHSCGRLLDDHDRQVRFTLPDPVLALPDRERTAGTWMTKKDPSRAVMMQVPGVGAFVRVLLPVRLTGGFTVTFGLWLGVHPDDLQRAVALWWEPDYPTLRLDGVLANAIPPWGLLGEPVEAGVRDPDETPYCERSTSHDLARVLNDEWPHEDVLAALP